jgi:hypothetical protein
MSKTYIAVQSGGYWGNACQRNGFLKSGESCVIEYQQFQTFMNTGKVSRPMFSSTHYAVCVQVAKDLNESANEIELQRQLAEWVAARGTN